ALLARPLRAPELPCKNLSRLSLSRSSTKQRPQVRLELPPIRGLRAVRDVAVGATEVQALGARAVLSVELAGRIEHDRSGPRERIGLLRVGNDDVRRDDVGVALLHLRSDRREVRVALGGRCCAVEEEERVLRAPQELAETARAIVRCI